MTCENREGRSTRRSSSVQCTQCVRIYWEHMVSAVPKMGVLIVLLATRTISFRIRGLKQYIWVDGIDQINFSKWSKQRREWNTYIFYFLLHCSIILGFMDFIFKTCLSNAFICCTVQKNLLISKPGKRKACLQNQCTIDKHFFISADTDNHR